MSWEVVEGGVFLEELKDSGLGAEPSLRALYPHKEFHPRAPNPPASAGPFGGDPRLRLYLAQNKKKSFGFVFFSLLFFSFFFPCVSSGSSALLQEHLCSPSWEFPPPCSIPDGFPGARRFLRDQTPAGKELHQPCLTLIHPHPALPHFQADTAEQRGISGPLSIHNLPSVEAAHILWCSSFLL